MNDREIKSGELIQKTTKLACRNRFLRQEALREFIGKQRVVQAIFSTIKKIEALDPSSNTFLNELAQLKVANEQRLKILGKYLPDLKNSEISTENGEALTIQIIKYAGSNTE